MLQVKGGLLQVEGGQLQVKGGLLQVEGGTCRRRSTAGGTVVGTLFRL